ncbi:SDR family NAD(P)-dependent oxidoreductase [Wenxinia saemankumensis]|uniref:Short-chain dehydrogenase n=1 Tax=Wenxinia saemankumensis TaxID=1447782 RepID=A0A1M6GP09_9RHOB|nr:SDR family oxidoreductase [Wenxinia saemankumensis]SHJ11673.1 hypothetical protein SAMN05444417_2835 [Wenxinia saemankumensis]
MAAPAVALVTGASSGIGRELARLHAEAGGTVVVTARRAGALEDLARDIAADTPGRAIPLPCDLGAPGGARRLIEAVEEDGHEIGVLMNNAGFGGAGRHVERPLQDELGMIDLNVRALVELTHHFGARMAARGGGRILNVGSSAGLIPAGPNQSVYFATKAFVASYSQGIAAELAPKGVSVTVLAPGYVETEFADTANLRGTKLVKTGGRTPRQTAEAGYAAMMKGRRVAYDRPGLGAGLWLARVAPARLVAGLMGRMQETEPGRR